MQIWQTLNIFLGSLSYQDFRETGPWAELPSAKDLWDRYWWRAGQLLASFVPLSLVTVPEIFAKLNSSQFPSRGMNFSATQIQFNYRCNEFRLTTRSRQHML